MGANEGKLGLEFFDVTPSDGNSGDTVGGRAFRVVLFAG
jgi:hypothetical protein